MNIDIQQVQHIVNLVNQSPIQGLSISDGQQSLQINKWTTPQPMTSLAQPSRSNNSNNNPFLTSTPQNSQNKRSNSKSKANSEPSGGLGGQIANTRDVDTGRIIAANHVGYLRLRADDVTPVLVKVGDTVSKGQTLAYVQSTVKMLPVTANISGQITDILANDGDKIEYGQALFALARD